MKAVKIVGPVGAQTCCALHRLRTQTRAQQVCAPTHQPLRVRPLHLLTLTLTFTFTLAPQAFAQFELKSAGFTHLYQGAVPISPSNTPPILPGQPQFEGAISVASGSSSRADVGTLAERYPSQIYLAPSTGEPTGAAMVMLRSGFGGAFAAGVPRYLLGDVIEPPLTQADGTTVASATYWRVQPVRSGELFTHPDSSTATPLAGGLTPSYYYSPHAERTFATQSGRVSITWASRVPVAIAGDATLRYRFRTEIFAVSAATTRPARTIYWTERTFNGPVVSIPAGQIEAVNPIYSTNFPAQVATEYVPPGTNPPDPSATAPAEKRTLWFQKIGGVGELRAYNLEGRLFVEYLGALKQSGGDSHVFLGADIVEVARVAPPVVAIVNLGDRITPRDSLGRLLPLDAASEWLAAPVVTAGVNAQSYYGSVTRADGRTIYHAERENENPDRVTFYWLEPADAAIHLLAPPAKPNLGLFWPKHKNTYAQVWPSGVSDFAHYTVPTPGSTTATGVQFPAGQLPEIIFQDDPAQTQATFDPTTQRLQVTFVNDALNRSLLKFTSGREVWYVRVYTQAADRTDFQEGDGAVALNATAYVGDRLEAPVGYSKAGYIASGDGYLPGAYLNPFTAGVTAAEQGAIIPVNAIPGTNSLHVWWFKKIEPPSATFQPFYVPAKIGRYTLAYPTSPSTIVLASNSGSGDLAPAETAGSLYVQNDRTLPGFNPNEEHALMIAGRVYALRDDLNVTTADAALYTSQPFALVRYTSPADGRPAMHAFKIEREVDRAGTNNDIVFNYPINAGTIVQPPMPLPLLPLPLTPAGAVRNTEVAGVADTTPVATAPDHYTRFTFTDRKGFHWIYRGPHAAAIPTFGMQFYYTMREGFYVPGVTTQPAIGTILPYLRPGTAGNYTGDPVTGTALTVTYRPAWPANAPVLRVAETLTLPKFGLPAILPQASAQVFYQQSVATTANSPASVVLHDPIREKTVALGATGGLQTIPTSILTTIHLGKTYFQRLPPHLQSRIYFDPARGAQGALVFLGKFVDEVAGEDYLHLNVLSDEDRSILEALPAATDASAALWRNAIAALTTRVETFIEDPARAGAFIPNSSPVTVGPQEVATISNPDTAVVDYALTATGAASGWVTLVFGNGRAFTPAGDPVAVQVFKVTPQLYTGELKVQLSSNPLDEQVSLRHSGDFAARPQDYDFEWRYAPPQDGVAPPTYSITMSPWTSGDWYPAQTPGATLPTATQYSATALPLPRSVTINAVAPVAGQPGLVFKAANALTLTGTLPQKIVFSATTADLTGFVLYVNGVAALAHQTPAVAGFTNVTAGTGLAPGALAKQFTVDANAFRLGANTLEVALYSTADVGTTSGIDFQLQTSTEIDLVAAGAPWIDPEPAHVLLKQQVVVGGSPTAPLGSPLLVMTDNYFTMRYRPKASANSVAGTTYSRWMPPKLVEGWIKRVLAAVNPFNQRMRDLANNAVNTDVSLLTQAGKRWEGDIALTIENINDVGLIEIYETVLGRGRTLSVDAGFDYAPANDALLLAAGYLADLYMIAGNEAYADAANPTISIDDSTTVTEVNTSRFSFEGQVKSVLEEELSLLRGRDDFLAPGVSVSPAYNRLFWNYTRGINSGEALYAVNYNIREKAGSSTADGAVDAADAQRMFPQGHGDAYGHYLTALTGYYRLLRNPKFTWTPRSEAVTVLGQAVQVDYFDERKFAAAAAGIARTAQQIVALTQRQVYQDNSDAGWTNFEDGKDNSATGNTRHWGLDEWAARSTQGAYLHWVVGNALLPDVDNNPTHTGVQVIDRKTVPELAELSILGSDFQIQMDNANSRLNPLGLSPGAIAFDISAAELKAGKSHYEQIYERALRSVLNAKGAFDQAARMTRLLRNQENQLGDQNNAIVDQESAFNDRLIELFGTPYSGEIGAGKTYAQGYTGPDTQLWFVIDRPTDLVDTTNAVRITARVPTGVATFGALSVDALRTYYQDSAVRNFETHTLTIQPNQFAQFSQVFRNGAAMGARTVTGTLQQALLDGHEAWIAVQAANRRLQDRQQIFAQRGRLFDEMVTTHEKSAARTDEGMAKIGKLKLASAALTNAARIAEALKEKFGRDADSAADALPKVTGLANDVFSGVRGALTVGLNTVGFVFKGLAIAASSSATYLGTEVDSEFSSIDRAIAEFGFSYEQAQVAYEYELMLRELITQHFELAQLATALQRTAERVRNLIAEGDRIQAEREIFRQRAAALIQGYRTRDLTFRTFRNEGLEQYRSLFDLASRYTFLAAKSYDYETGLLGSAAGQSVVNGIVAARALGDLTNGAPQATVSTLGDSGLAGTMARLQSDWSVAKGRLGINNPDTNGTLFSLRRELFRLLDDPAQTDDDAAWQQTLEQHIVSNLLADPDVAAQCRNLANADGSPVAGIIIPFSTTIRDHLNFFGLPLAVGDHAFTPSNFATKIYAVGLVFRGYIGMDPYVAGTPNAPGPALNAPNALSAAPYAYLIPTGTDYMRAPALGDTGAIRGWSVKDQALPLPFNLGATAFSSTQFFSANGTLNEQPWILRKHQSFRPVSDPVFFYGSVPAEFTNTRLVGRSVWNSGWKIVIPAKTLLANEQDGLNRFAASVKDIELFLRTYSHSGN